MRRETSAVARYVAPIALIASAWALLGSCSVRQEVSLSRDGSGTTTMEISLDSVLSEYMRDLVASTGAGSDGPIFDTEAIERSFAERPGVTARRVELSDRDKLSLELAFEDIGELVASRDDAVQRLVSVRRNGDATAVTFRATPRTVRDALAISPMYGSQASSFLLPGEGSSLSAAEYTEQLAWALEEYAGDRPVREVVSESTIRLDVQVDGELISQRGGERLSRNTVRFEIPVVELLTMQEEQVFELRFR